MHVEIEKLTYTYPDGYKAIDDISFSIRKGENVALIGANGAGKSTMLQLLIGLFIATEGTLKVNGKEINKKNIDYVRKEIGFIFQDSDNQVFMNTVYDDIAFGLRSAKVSEEEILKRVNNILEQNSIKHLKNKHVYKLSGGQKRTVAISGVLVMEPNILLMDEPTASLDPKSRRTLINTLKSLEQTKIIATHDLDMVMDICHRVIILNEGKVIADGKSNEILMNKELLERCSLELPLCLQVREI